MLSDSYGNKKYKVVNHDDALPILKLTMVFHGISNI